MLRRVCLGRRRLAVNALAIDHERDGESGIGELGDGCSEQVPVLLIGGSERLHRLIGDWGCRWSGELGKVARLYNPVEGVTMCGAVGEEIGDCAKFGRGGDRASGGSSDSGPISKQSLAHISTCRMKHCK